jgi:hypothetical protein
MSDTRDTLDDTLIGGGQVRDAVSGATYRLVRRVIHGTERFGFVRTFPGEPPGDAVLGFRDAPFDGYADAIQYVLDLPGATFEVLR